MNSTNEKKKPHQKRFPLLFAIRSENCGTRTLLLNCGEWKKRALTALH